ncbi:hypothetical protein DFS34DRAFT_260913 [Phlyctochytrium arcticum]|nr:hypothetical protein DFS34DRAFT_260913 [Phlyctochytrium arcticum]
MRHWWKIRLCNGFKPRQVQCTTTRPRNDCWRRRVPPTPTTRSTERCPDRRNLPRRLPRNRCHPAPVSSSAAFASNIPYLVTFEFLSHSLINIDGRCQSPPKCYRHQDVRVCDHGWMWAFKLEQVTTASQTVVACGEKSYTLLTGQGWQAHDKVCQQILKQAVKVFWMFVVGQVKKGEVKSADEKARYGTLKF